eukprot:979889_1
MLAKILDVVFSTRALFKHLDRWFLFDTRVERTGDLRQKVLEHRAQSILDETRVDTCLLLHEYINVLPGLAKAPNGVHQDLGEVRWSLKFLLRESANTRHIVHWPAMQGSRFLCRKKLRILK